MNVAPCKKQEVYLYINNQSWVDTLATVSLAIDDTVLIRQTVPHRQVSSSRFFKLIHLCPGVHRAQVHFGRYAQDTTFVVNQSISLITSMNYDTIYDASASKLYNGLVVATLSRDGSPGDD
jgi:hypothetical protein